MGACESRPESMGRDAGHLRTADKRAWVGGADRAQDLGALGAAADFEVQHGAVLGRELLVGRHGVAHLPPENGQPRRTCGAKLWQWARVEFGIAFENV